VRLPARRGFSLMEIILASGILVGCLVVLSELAAIGRIHASVAQDGTAAARICRTKVNEILAGLASAEPVQEEPVDFESGWTYSVEVEPLPLPGVLALHVSVSQEEVPGQRPLHFSLVRWIRDPKQQSLDSGIDGGELRLPPGFRGGRLR